MKTKHGDIAVLYCSPTTLAVVKGSPPAGNRNTAVERGAWSFTDGSLATALQEFRHAHALNNATLYLMLPRHEVTARTFTLPSQDRDEILKMIRLNADAHVPYALDELVTDALILSTLPSGESRVMGIYAHKAVLAPYLKLLDAAGLEAEGILLSTSGYCGIQADDGIVVDCGFDGLEIALLKSGMPVFSRGVALPQSWDSVGQDTSQGHAATEELIQEIHTSIAAFQREHDQEIDRAPVQCGGIVETADDIARALTTSLSRECTPLDSDALPIAMSGALDVVQSVETPFINLLPDDRIQQRNRKQLQQAAKKSALLVVVLILTLGGLFYQAQSRRSQRIDELTKALDLLEPQAQGVASQREQLMILEREVNQAGNALETLAAIAHVAPGGGLNFNRYLYERDTGVKVWGKALSLDTINQFRSAIREYNSDSLDLLRNAQSMYERQTQEWGKQVYIYHLDIPRHEEGSHE